MKPGYYYGVALVAALALVSVFIASSPFFAEELRLSPLVISVIIGMVYANTLRQRLPVSWEWGLAFASKKILRLSIVLYAFRLTFADILVAGFPAFLYDVIVVASVILLGTMIGKWLKLDSDTAILTSAGSAICGAAAVLGTEPVLKANPSKTVIAVATVVIFGTLSMFLYPALYNAGLLDLTVRQMAVFTGGTIHEVAHVAGAGAAMGDEIASTATITKMIRVILLAPFLLMLSKWVVNGRKNGAETGTKKLPIPWFAIWFLVMIGVNTLLSYGAESMGVRAEYASLLGVIKVIDDFGLCMAMAALGMDASFRKFRQAGVRPFALAGILFLWLTIGGYFLAKVLI